MAMAYLVVVFLMLKKSLMGRRVLTRQLASERKLEGIAFPTGYSQMSPLRKLEVRLGSPQVEWLVRQYGKNASKLSERLGINAVRLSKIWGKDIVWMSRYFSEFQLEELTRRNTVVRKLLKKTDKEIPRVQMLRAVLSAGK